MTPSFITQWLRKPAQSVDVDMLRELREQYPYFTPLRYMAAAAGQQEGKPVHLSGNEHLYAGNPVLFHQLMAQANILAVRELLATVLPGTTPESQQEGETEALTKEPADAVFDDPQLTPDVAAAAVEETGPPVTTEAALQTNEEPQEEPLIQPVFTEDYFLHQGIEVADSIPAELDAVQKQEEEKVDMPAEDPKSLMVVMSFTDWLMHYKSKTEKEKEEEEDRKAVRHMWQKEKLAAALEEEDDEIPENVFEMAVNSISKEDGLVSESLAEVLAKQGKPEKAIEMYRKLSLRNPQKSAYFAQQIAAIQKKFS